jgi:hypothetical protein
MSAESRSTYSDPIAANVKARERLQRKLKNYKLKHSRLLTCYSGLIFLLNKFQRNQTVHPGDVLEMVSLSPTQRLEQLAGERRDSSTKNHVDAVLQLYERFLLDTDKEEPRLVAEFLDRDQARTYAQNANRLGDKVYELMSSVGETSPFFRLLVV